jgi:hypothetical protein
MRQVQLSDRLYQEASLRADEVGFKSVDDFVEEIVQIEIENPKQSYDQFFNSEVLADLDRIDAKIKAGAKTYSSEEADEYLRMKAKEWRDSQSS